MQGPTNTLFPYNSLFTLIGWQLVILDYHFMLCRNNGHFFIMQNFIYSKTIIVKWLTNIDEFKELGLNNIMYLSQSIS